MRPRYLKEQTCSKDKDPGSPLFWKLIFPVAESYLITFDFLADISRWWVLQKCLVMFISFSRAWGERPINTISSMKNIVAMLCDERSMPRPDLFSSWPKLLTKREKRMGDKLQPGTKKSWLLRDHTRTNVYTDLAWHHLLAKVHLCSGCWQRISRSRFCT